MPFTKQQQSVIIRIDQSKKMENKKALYITLIVAGLILVFVGAKFGLKGALFVDRRLVAMKEVSDSSTLEKDLAQIEKQEVKDEIINCNVVIVGGGAGGTSAAIASAREGATTCLVEETDWLGGMITSAGVFAIDGRPDTPSGIFKEFIQNVENHYIEVGQGNKIHNCNVSYLCAEPSVGNYIFKQMATAEKNLKVFYNAKVDKVYREDNQILGIHFIQNNKNFVVNAAVTIDATEFGDLMYLANVPYDLGMDKDSEESLTRGADQCIQPLTYVAILQKLSSPQVIEKPKNYDREKYKCIVKSPLCPDSNSLFGIERLLSYGRMPNDKLMINFPSHSYGNDFHATIANLESYSREEILEEAKDYSKGLIYFLQTELGFEYFGLANEFGTADKFAKIPYVRESRRLKGVKRLTQADIVKGDGVERSNITSDAIAIGDYPIDLHFCQYGVGDIYKPIAPYQIPYGVTIPEKINSFMVVDKNISVSHIVNGTTRLQPVTMSVGQAVGTAAAMASQEGVEPRNINIQDLQNKLLAAKGNLFFFKDLPTDHYAYQYVAHLAIKGLILGYSDFTFKPNEAVNQSDLFKIFKVYLEMKNKDESLMSNLELAENSKTAVKRKDMINYLYILLENSNKLTGSKDPMTFKDISINTDLYNKLGELVNLGIISNNTSFRPNDNLTRADAMVLLGRTFDQLLEESPL